MPDVCLASLSQMPSDERGAASSNDQLAQLLYNPLAALGSRSARLEPLPLVVSECRMGSLALGW